VIHLLISFFLILLYRFLTFISHKYILTEDTVLVAVKTSKQTMYPNGYPGPPPILPTAEEQGMMKEQLISELLERIPGESDVDFLMERALG